MKKDDIYIIDGEITPREKLTKYQLELIRKAKKEGDRIKELKRNGELKRRKKRP